MHGRGPKPGGQDDSSVLATLHPRTSLSEGISVSDNPATPQSAATTLPRVVNKPRRNHRSAKKAGSSFETLVADYLATQMDDDRIERRTRNGAKDRGDIAGVRTVRGERVVIECKNVASISLPAWLREAEVERGNDDAVIGVVAHKRVGSARPHEQYVTMTLATFSRLLQGGEAL